MKVDAILVKALKGDKLTAAEAAILVDEFKRAEAERLAANKVAAELKAHEIKVKQVLIKSIQDLGTSAIGGKAFTCTHTITEEPTITDWAAYQKYILKTKDFSLLERRPGKAAIKERWDDGVAVPGVSKFTVDKLSFSKVKV